MELGEGVRRGSSEASDSASTIDTNTSASSLLNASDIDLVLPAAADWACEVLGLDKKTPDSHVPRDPRLVRLTGVHPFNSEAPLSTLFDQGFLTPIELFYVRNHGAVPIVLDEDVLSWELRVEGLVEKPLTLSLQQLLTEFKNVTYPVTLVCAGNRRKEQNQVRKTKGFSWGPAGVSTALFTGVPMADVIIKACPHRKAKYVYMEGSDQLPNGHYGTSVKLSWVMDRERGIMLAHGMNGRPLHPDHGRPLRAVIPGQIGGRSVKWLTKLVLTDSPSDNWYHIYDNRVLPTPVSPEVAANEPKWWMDERYAIYDLSPNSVIAYPAHGEQMNLDGALDSYTARGYAYAGGGRRVSRVEISLDKGITWALADIDYVEDLYRDSSQTLFGGELDMSRDTCLCWCFWSLEIPVRSLLGAKDILVRAMDESMCMQPRDMYWNVLGMMNNPWYRISIARDGKILKFEHPTQPALQPGGWMERVKKSGGILTDGFWGEAAETGSVPKTVKPVQEEITMVKKGCTRIVSSEELKSHENEDSPWFVVRDEVYDGTAFLKEHPGGAQSIYSAAGTDATDEFMAIHSETAKAMMIDYHIGTLDASAKTRLGMSQSIAGLSDEPRALFLQSRIWSNARLVSKKEISWDSRIFTFQLDHPTQKLGLPIGQHLMIRLRDPVTREAIIRSYTPVSKQSLHGFMEVLVKIYFASTVSAAGLMSTALDSLPLGHEVEFKGPIGKFEYLGKGKYLLNGVERNVNEFLMICGGSGVTPILQVFRAVMSDTGDATRCTVITGNRLRQDILCKEELDALVVEGRGKGSVHYTLSKPDNDWDGIKGRVDGPLIAKVFTRAAKTVALICGPDEMEKSMKQALEEMGWEDDQIIFF